MKKISLVTLLALVLTACGSGGSGGNSSGKTRSIDLVADNLKTDITKLKTLELDDGLVFDIAEMSVGYHSINLDDGKIIFINGAYYVIGTWVPDSLEYDEHGLSFDDEIDGFNHPVSHNTKMNDLPKSGKVTYEGESLGVATRGKLQLSVDFSDKSLNGKIYDRHLKSKQLADINLTDGKIISSGNNEALFYGNSSYSDYKGTFKGNFVGPKGEEVIGHVINEDGKTYVGFGGSRK